MAFFSKFDLDDFKFDGVSYNIENITSRVINDPSLSFNSVYLSDFYIESGLRPDHLAQKLYSDVDMWWTFFIANNITANDWPLSDSEFDDWCDYKYTPYELHKVVSVETDDGIKVPYVIHNNFIVDGELIEHHTGDKSLYDGYTGSGTSIAYSIFSGNQITLYDKLKRENEAKRNIKIVKPIYIQEFSQDFFSKIGNG